MVFIARFMMTFALMLLILIVGLLVGLPASMVGVGGGFIIVPVLIMVFQLPINNAIAISLVAICGTTMSSALTYAWQRKINYKLALFYDVLDIPGVVAGAYLTTIFPPDVLAGICGCLLVLIATLLIRNKRKKIESPCSVENVEDNHQEVSYLRKPHFVLLSSFLGGITTGLCGLGGGIIDVSTMILLGIPPHIAAASSEFAMALTNGVGVLSHGLLNNILFEYAVPLTIGTVIGAQIGCLLAKRVNGRIIRRALSILAIFAGLRLIFQFLSF